MLNRKTIFVLAIFTLLGFGLIGYWIMVSFLHLELNDVLQKGYPWYMQALLGVLYGLLTAMAGWEIVKLPILKSTKTFFVDLIGSLKLTLPEIIFISFCAGVGEEVLFRGAIQPYLGIWLTSVFFVLIHGYLNPFNWRISIYGLFMTLVIVGIGHLTVEFGLFTSIIAHTVIDIVLLFKLTKDKSS